MLCIPQINGQASFMKFLKIRFVKECFAQKFIIQKLDYTQLNPCTAKWSLADCPENYIHSSAGFYSKGIQGIFFN